MATTLEPRIDVEPLRRAQRTVLRRLGVVRRKLRSHLAVEGLFWVASAAVLLAGLSLALDWSVRLNFSTRMAVLALAAVAIAGVAMRRLIQPLLLPLANLDLAELLDRRQRGVGQQISNVLQLPDLLESEHYGSPGMIHAAVSECAAAIAKVDLSDTLNASRRKWLLAAIGGLVVSVVLFWLLAPTTAGIWSRRWFQGSDERWPQQTYMTLVGLGSERKLLVPRGETSLLQINAQPQFSSGGDGYQHLLGRGEALRVAPGVSLDSHPPDRVSIAVRLTDGTIKRGNATQFDEANFRYELPPLAEPATLTVTGGDDWLEPIEIEPIDRPAVSSLRITATRPGDSQPQTQTLGEGSSQFLYLSQTQLELELVANQPLESADVMDRGKRLSWQRVDGRTYTMRWTMSEPLALEFRLVGLRGSLTSKPYFLAIGLLKDREPRLTILSRGVGRRVTPAARIPLTVRATDDFGVASLALDMERTELREDKPQVTAAKVELGSENAATDAPLENEIEFKHEFLLKDRGLAAGNMLRLRGTATDNCALGSQSGNSRWLTFQIVGTDELFYEILVRLREQRGKFQIATESQHAQTKALVALVSRDEAYPIARAQQLIARQVWQIANQIEAALEEMELNDLGNPQARELLQTSVIAPTRSLHDELFARLRASIDRLTQQDAVSEERRAEAQELSEQAVKAMQTILAQMAQWESFVDVINQLKQIIQRQDDLLKNTEEIQKKRVNELFDE